MKGEVGWDENIRLREMQIHNRSIIRPILKENMNSISEKK